MLGFNSFNLMWSTHRNCSHIIDIYDKTEHSSKEKGNLYLSGVHCLGDLNLRTTQKIASVVSIIDSWALNSFKVKEKLEHLEIKEHKWFEIDDIEEESIYPFLEEGHSVIKTWLEKSNVLVHCQMGISRSSSLVIAFLMK